MAEVGAQNDRASLPDGALDPGSATSPSRDFVENLPVPASGAPPTALVHPDAPDVRGAPSAVSATDFASVASTTAAFAEQLVGAAPALASEPLTSGWTAPTEHSRPSRGYEFRELDPTPISDAVAAIFAQTAPILCADPTLCTPVLLLEGSAPTLPVLDGSPDADDGWSATQPEIIDFGVKDAPVSVPPPMPWDEPPPRPCPEGTKKKCCCCCCDDAPPRPDPGHSPTKHVLPMSESDTMLDPPTTGGCGCGEKTPQCGCPPGKRSACCCVDEVDENVAPFEVPPEPPPPADLPPCDSGAGTGIGAGTGGGPCSNSSGTSPAGEIASTWRQIPEEANRYFEDCPPGTQWIPKLGQSLNPPYNDVSGCYPVQCPPREDIRYYNQMDQGCITYPRDWVPGWRTSGPVGQPGTGMPGLVSAPQSLRVLANQVVIEPLRRIEPAASSSAEGADHGTVVPLDQEGSCGCAGAAEGECDCQPKELPDCCCCCSKPEAPPEGGGPVHTLHAPDANPFGNDSRPRPPGFDTPAAQAAEMLLPPDEELGTPEPELDPASGGGCGCDKKNAQCECPPGKKPGCCCLDDKSAPTAVLSEPAPTPDLPAGDSGGAIGVGAGTGGGPSKESRCRAFCATTPDVPRGSSPPLRIRPPGSPLITASIGEPESPIGERPAGEIPADFRLLAGAEEPYFELCPPGTVYLDRIGRNVTTQMEVGGCWPPKCPRDSDIVYYEVHGPGCLDYPESWKPGWRGGATSAYLPGMPIAGDGLAPQPVFRKSGRSWKDARDALAKLAALMPENFVSF